MHIKWIRGTPYQYESFRAGGKVTSFCFGRVPSDFLPLYQQVAEDRRWMRSMGRREKRRKSLQASKARDSDRSALATLQALETVDGEIGEYGLEVDAAVAAALEALGFHRPKRGEWRRRRAMRRQDVQATNGGDLERLAEAGEALMKERLPAALVEAASKPGGRVEQTCETMALDLLAGARDPERRKAVEARMDLMRLELAPPGSDPIVRLLASRVVLDWLHCHSWEILVSNAMTGTSRVSEKVLDRFERRYDRHAARYQRSLVNLARVRRLAIPVLVGQINIAASGGQQVNQAKIENL